MATGLPGWYPDPAGARGRFRYWDGAQWSTVTIDDPRQAPPAQPDQPLLTLHTESKSPQGLPRKRRLAVIIGVLAVVGGVGGRADRGRRCSRLRERSTPGRQRVGTHVHSDWSGRLLTHRDSNPHQVAVSVSDC